MKPKVYTYERPEKQEVAFRGYVESYGPFEKRVTLCPQVRKNKLKSMEDAKKLLAKLRRENKLQVK